MSSISRARYAALYGPTTGDRVRLADTNLVVRIEHDYAVYGEEAVFGGGKTIRDGMAQAPWATSARGSPDTVITSAIILDPVLGVVKGDIGIKDGRIVADRQGRQPRHHGRRRSAARHRSRHGDHRRRAHDRDARRHRLPHSHDLPAAGVGRALERHHHPARWRHRSRGRHARDDLHARPLAHRAHARKPRKSCP